ncbi:MAG: LPS export ABC transporter periplasmic protein LptC [Treponema sp.]|jgi:LPS export ABC transporter protein LptC|nr:LPS export ABC transporter periplasmic protein LptC [Treponema sp.]
MKGKKITKGRLLGPFLLMFSVFILYGACSFDYGPTEEEEGSQPDIVMNDVEYVRVRDGDPVVRFRAELAERYETRQTMELKNFSFEQFNTRGDEVNAEGRAGAALVELDSGNIHMDQGISISVESEDVTINTASLDWQDKERTLSGAENGLVDIERSDGTNFSGRGFFADARERRWSFSAGVEGSYFHEDDEEEEADEEAEADGEAGPDEPPDPEGTIPPEGEAAPEPAAEPEPALWS